jgi:hypothetical protein
VQRHAVAARHAPEVRSGAERPVAGTPQHDHPHRRIGVGVGECGAHGADQLPGQRVATLGSVDDQAGDGAVDVVEEPGCHLGAVSHGRRPYRPPRRDVATVAGRRRATTAAGSTDLGVALPGVHHRRRDGS